MPGTKVASFLGPARPLPPRTAKQIQWQSVGARGAGQDLPFSLMRQEENNWCWAAVAQAIEFARTGRALSQQQIATDHISKHLGGTCDPPARNARNRGKCGDGECDAACGSMHAISVVLADRGLLRGTLSTGGPVTLSQIKNEIAAGRPIVCRLDANGAGHFICIAGWWTGPAGLPQVLVHDPGVGPKGHPVEPIYRPLAVVQDRYPMGAAYGRNNRSYSVV